MLLVRSDLSGIRSATPLISITLDVFSQVASIKLSRLYLPAIWQHAASVPYRMLTSVGAGMLMSSACIARGGERLWAAGNSELLRRFGFVEASGNNPHACCQAVGHGPAAGSEDGVWNHQQVANVSECIANCCADVGVTYCKEPRRVILDPKRRNCAWCDGWQDRWRSCSAHRSTCRCATIGGMLMVCSVYDSGQQRASEGPLAARRCGAAPS